MIAKAYRMADAVSGHWRSGGYGGPHVTEMADEALGAMAARATPTRLRWARPMLPGRKL